MRRLKPGAMKRITENDGIASCTGAQIETKGHAYMKLVSGIASCTGAQIETLVSLFRGDTASIASCTGAQIETGGRH